MHRQQPRFRASRAAGMAAAAAVAVVVGEAGAQDIQRGGTLNFARESEPLTLDPVGPSDNGSIWAIEQICEALVEPDETGEGLEPAVAESWEVSDDRLEYTFRIRDDARFSNGDQVTVEDVVFSLRRASNPDSPYAFAMPWPTIEAVDDSHVRITLDEPYQPMLSSASLFTASIIHQETFESDPDGFGQQPMCSGPFAVESYERGSRLVLARNEHYWEMGEDGEPLPYLDEVVIPYVPESNSRLLGLQSGEYDAIATVPFNQAAQVEEMEGVTLEIAPMYRLDYVYLNHAAPPLDDKNIRLALNYAAPREQIIETAYFGYGELPNSYMPKINYHCAEVEPIPYDPDKAKELIEEAGYDGETIELMVETGHAQFRQIATILQQAWQQVGLDVEIVEYDVGTAYGRTETGDYQAFVSYITSDLNDQDELATLQGDHRGASEAFWSRYENDEVVEWLAQARRTDDPDERQELYCQIQETAYWDGYSVPLNFVPAANAYQDYVKNFGNITTGWWWLKDVWLDK